VPTWFDPMFGVDDAAHRQRDRTRRSRRLERENRRCLRDPIGSATIVQLRLHHRRHSKVNTRQFLGLDEALSLLHDTVSAVAAPAQVIAIADAAGRVVAHDVRAPMNVPPFMASAMDGYAVCSLDPVFTGDPPFSLVLYGESRAGAAMHGARRVDHAVRIFTGAMIPDGCDAIVIQEDVERQAASIMIAARPIARTYVRPPGHDIAAGATLVRAGTRLGPFDLAWLVASGLTNIAVRPRIRLALFSTGDELRDAGATLRPDQIYDANRFVLKQLLHRAPVDVNDLGILPDDPEVIEATLRAAAEHHDVVLTSGGVSVGDADYVRDVVARLGHIEFWKVAIKPGKPLAYGRIGSTQFFGLPGNPVSTIVTFLMLVKPILTALAGAPMEPALRVNAVLTTDIAHEPGRIEYQRGTYTNRDGILFVQPTSDQSSNRIGSFRDANCLLEVPRTSGNLARGSAVAILPFDGLLS
jgi:molybdopterin molybdotransferase